MLKNKHALHYHSMTIARKYAMNLISYKTNLIMHYWSLKIK